ncbi:hypothetical protein EDB89DRAFT_2231090 [Lactarius sanguifluus]|nr:hypothetical protein EDB89DRAFT_2231090 [Lactarius sanguifluus]
MVSKAEDEDGEPDFNERRTSRRTTCAACASLPGARHARKASAISISPPSVSSSRVPCALALDGLARKVFVRDLHTDSAAQGNSIKDLTLRTLPRRCTSHLLLVLGASSFTLYNHVLSRRRILIYAQPPVEVPCFLFQVAADLCFEDQTTLTTQGSGSGVGPQLKGKHKDRIDVLGIVTLQDIDMFNLLRIHRAPLSTGGSTWSDVKSGPSSTVYSTSTQIGTASRIIPGLGVDGWVGRVRGRVRRLREALLRPYGTAAVPVDRGSGRGPDPGANGPGAAARTETGRRAYTMTTRTRGNTILILLATATKTRMARCRRASSSPASPPSSSPPHILSRMRG